MPTIRSIEPEVIEYSDAEEFDCSELDSNDDIEVKPFQAPTYQVPLLRPQHKQKPFKKVLNSPSSKIMCMIILSTFVVVVVQVWPKKSHVSSVLVSVYLCALSVILMSSVINS